MSGVGAACFGLVVFEEASRGGPLDHRVRPTTESVDWEFPVTAARCRVHGSISQTRVVPPSPTAGSRRRGSSVWIGLDLLISLAARSDSSRADSSSGSFWLEHLPKKDLYFMDEPFAGVDAATEQAILEVLREMKREDGPSLWFTMTCRRSPLLLMK